MVKNDIKKFTYKGYKFKVDVCKSSTSDIDKWNVCWESAVSGKAILRIRTIDFKTLFYDKYGDNKNLYDFDSEWDIKNYIKNQSQKERNCNHVHVYCNLDVNEDTNELLNTHYNEMIINSTINLVIGNLGI